MATPLTQTPLHKKSRDWYRKKICGVYLITNKSNGMHYCGQSVDISARWQQHLTPNKSAIGSAIAEAPQRFTFRILELCPKEMLNDREKHYIQVYNCVYPNGYNKTNGGSSGSVCAPFSEEHRRKLSQAQIGNTKGKDHIVTKEHKNKLSDLKKGVPRTKEAKKKMSDSAKGKTFSEEHRRKMSETHKQRWAQKKLQQTSALSDDAPYIDIETDAQ